MKKVLFILFNLLTITAMAQTKGRFEVHDLGNCKLHIYYTNDALGDASYIVEGKDRPRYNGAAAVQGQRVGI